MKVTSSYRAAWKQLQAREFHYCNFLKLQEPIGDDPELDKVMPEVVHKVMVQVSLKQGLREFGECGKEAVAKELWQIHMRDTFAPRDINELTPEQRSKALDSLMFLEEKRSGKIKGQMCANGRKQRTDMKKGEAASPTVMLDSVLITAAIDTAEG